MCRDRLWTLPTVITGPHLGQASMPCNSEQGASVLPPGQHTLSPSLLHVQHKHHPPGLLTQHSTPLAPLPPHLVLFELRVHRPSCRGAPIRQRGVATALEDSTAQQGTQSTTMRRATALCVQARPWHSQQSVAFLWHNLVCFTAGPWARQCRRREPVHASATAPGPQPTLCIAGGSVHVAGAACDGERRARRRDPPMPGHPPRRLAPAPWQAPTGPEPASPARPAPPPPSSLPWTAGCSGAGRAKAALSVPRLPAPCGPCPPPAGAGRPSNQAAGRGTVRAWRRWSHAATAAAGTMGRCSNMYAGPGGGACSVGSSSHQASGERFGLTLSLSCSAVAVVAAQLPHPQPGGGCIGSPRVAAFYEPQRSGPPLSDATVLRRHPEQASWWGRRAAPGFTAQGAYIHGGSGDRCARPGTGRGVGCCGCGGNAQPAGAAAPPGWSSSACCPYLPVCPWP